MRVIGLLRRNWPEASWAAFAIANFVAMVLWPGWETIPFHFVWISLTLLLRLPGLAARGNVPDLGRGRDRDGRLILSDAFSGDQLWGELFEVPLMSAMFLAMVWHARRRQDALAIVERQAEQRASLLQRQERFLHDASHELRTPVTIARGHLEVHRRTNGKRGSEIDVALDELQRIEQILDRLLLLAKADQPDFVVARGGRPRACLEDVFMRWSEVAPRRGSSARSRPGSLRSIRKACALRSTRCSRTRSSTRSTATRSN